MNRDVNKNLRNSNGWSLPMSCLALSIALLAAYNTELLIHKGGSPTAIIIEGRLQETLLNTF